MRNETMRKCGAVFARIIALLKMGKEGYAG
jgi:hypothetical protein